MKYHGQVRISKLILPKIHFLLMPPAMGNCQKLSKQFHISTFVIMILVESGSTTLVANRYKRSTTCKLQDQIDSGCAQVQTGFKSLVQCTALCAISLDCVGVVYTDTKTCYFITSCSLTLTCSPNDDSVRLYVGNPCEHDGTWNVEQDTCKCVDGWVGHRCERLPKRCGELRDYGYPTGWPNGVRWVYLDLDTYPTPIFVQCNVFDTYDNTLVMQSSGAYSNNKTWDEYKQGFSHDEKNFWLGLEKIKALNDAGLNLLYLTTAFVDTNGQYNYFQRAVPEFDLHDAASKFTFNYGGYSWPMSYGPWSSSLTFNDCLGSLAGSKFSTWDDDNDQDSTRNCAAEAGVGWWFKDCDMVCNPLGLNPNTNPGLDSKTYVKMDGIDYLNGNYATNSTTSMFFYKDE